MQEFISTHRTQYLGYLVLSLGAALITVASYCNGPSALQRFLGQIDLLWAIAIAISLGFLFLSYLLYQGAFVIYRKENLRGWLYGTVLAAVLALIIIGVDLIVVFPPDFNVLFPESLLFYPVIAFFAEVFFHLLPLSLVILVATPFFKKKSEDRIIWAGMIAASLVDPAFQLLSGFSEAYPIWVGAYVGLHVFLINIGQLVVFRRFDFVSMYVFRLAYYLFWHIAWGYYRLGWLF